MPFQRTSCKKSWYWFSFFSGRFNGINQKRCWMNTFTRDACAALHSAVTRVLYHDHLIVSALCREGLKQAVVFQIIWNINSTPVNNTVLMDVLLSLCSELGVYFPEHQSWMNGDIWPMCLPIRVFHKHTKLAMLALLPTLYSYQFVVFFLAYVNLC